METLHEGFFFFLKLDPQLFEAEALNKQRKKIFDPIIYLPYQPQHFYTISCYSMFGLSKLRQLDIFQ